MDKCFWNVISVNVGRCVGYAVLQACQPTTEKKKPDLSLFDVGRDALPEPAALIELELIEGQQDLTEHVLASYLAPAPRVQNHHLLRVASKTI